MAKKAEPTPDSTEPSDDPKEKFRQALEKKKNKSGYGSESNVSSGSAAHGTSGKAGGKREFRRKSG